MHAGPRRVHLDCSLRQLMGKATKRRIVQSHGHKPILHTLRPRRPRTKTPPSLSPLLDTSKVPRHPQNHAGSAQTPRSTPQQPLSSPQCAPGRCLGGGGHQSTPRGDLQGQKPAGQNSAQLFCAPSRASSRATPRTQVPPSTPKCPLNIPQC